MLLSATTPGLCTRAPAGWHPVYSGGRWASKNVRWCTLRMLLACLLKRIPIEYSETRLPATPQDPVTLDMTTPSPSKSPTKYTSLMYRPHDAYSEKQLQIRADLKAKQATWSTEAQTSYASTAQTSTSDKRATMRKGRVVDETTPTNVVADPTSVSSRHGCTRTTQPRTQRHAGAPPSHPSRPPAHACSQVESTRAAVGHILREATGRRIAARHRYEACARVVLGVPPQLLAQVAWIE